MWFPMQVSGGWKFNKVLMVSLGFICVSDKPCTKQLFIQPQETITKETAAMLSPKKVPFQTYLKVI